MKSIDELIKIVKYALTGKCFRRALVGALQDVDTSVDTINDALWTEEEHARYGMMSPGTKQYVGWNSYTGNKVRMFDDYEDDAFLDISFNQNGSVNITSRNDVARKLQVVTTSGCAFYASSQIDTAYIYSKNVTDGVVLIDSSENLSKAISNGDKICLVYASGGTTFFPVSNELTSGNRLSIAVILKGETFRGHIINTPSDLAGVILSDPLFRWLFYKEAEPSDVKRNFASLDEVSIRKFYPNKGGSTNDSSDISKDSIGIGAGLNLETANSLALGKYNSKKDAQFVIGSGTAEDNRRDMFYITQAGCYANGFYDISRNNARLVGAIKFRFYVDQDTEEFKATETHSNLKLYLSQGYSIIGKYTVDGEEKFYYPTTVGANDEIVFVNTGYVIEAGGATQLHVNRFVVSDDDTIEHDSGLL